jgi:hypothetical protein
MPEATNSEHIATDVTNELPDDNKEEEQKHSTEEEFVSDSIFDIQNDWIRREQRVQPRTPPAAAARRARGWYRHRLLECCQCFLCYVVGVGVIAFCVYFMYQLFSRIKWSSLAK